MEHLDEAGDSVKAGCQVPQDGSPSVLVECPLPPSSALADGARDALASGTEEGPPILELAGKKR